MTEITVAVITTFGVIIVGLLGYLGVVATKTREHAQAARYQVQNSHPTNLRDDLDEKFEVLADLVRSAIADIGGMKEDIRIIHRTQNEDRAAAREAVRVLEQTMPKARQRATKPKE